VGHWHPRASGGSSGGPAFTRAGQGSIVVGQATVTVTFTSPVTSANYAVDVTSTTNAVWSSNAQLAMPTVINKTVNGFDLIMVIGNTGASRAIITNNFTFDYTVTANT